MGNVLIGDDDGVFHHVAQVSQTGAQDHGHLGLETAQLGPQEVGALLIVRIGKVHKITSACMMCRSETGGKF